MFVEIQKYVQNCWHSSWIIVFKIILFILSFSSIIPRYFWLTYTKNVYCKLINVFYVINQRIVVAYIYSCDLFLRLETFYCQSKNSPLSFSKGLPKLETYNYLYDPKRWTRFAILLLLYSAVWWRGKNIWIITLKLFMGNCLSFAYIDVNFIPPVI